MKEIREWLEKGGPYAAGVALYETHGKSQVVLKTLRYGETDFTRATLRRELAKMVQAGSEKDTGCGEQEPGPTAPVGAVGPISSEKDTGSPPAGTRADEQRRTWLAIRAHTHAQLELVATDQERRQLCAEVLALSEKITASFAQPGAHVKAPRPLPLDAGEARRQLTNRRALRSKLRSRPDRAGDLARVEEEIRELETVLKNRDGEPQLHPRH